jgi:hypothetical protein
VARAAAAFDLVVTAALAIPGIDRRFVELLNAADAALGFATAPIALPPFGFFLANLAGALGVLWALVRLARPEPHLVRADAIARCFVAFLIVHAVALRGVTPVLLAFAATELLGAVAQLWALARRA